MLKKLLATASLLIAAASAPALAQGTPDALVRKISTDVIDAARQDKDIQSGDIAKIIALVDAKVMPSVNFEVMTRSAVGPQWRGTTPEQRSRLQTEFKTLLVRVYAGALTLLKDQTVDVTDAMPVSGSSQIIVKSVVSGKGETVKLDYRLDRFGDAWKIIDVNVGGIWLVQSYRSQFGPVLSGGGVDALINRLVEQNKANSKA